MTKSEVEVVVQSLWMHSYALRSLGWDHADLRYDIDERGVRIRVGMMPDVLVLDRVLVLPQVRAIRDELKHFEAGLEQASEETLDGILLRLNGPAVLDALREAGYGIS